MKIAGRALTNTIVNRKIVVKKHFFLKRSTSISLVDYYCSSLRKQGVFFGEAAVRIQKEKRKRIKKEKNTERTEKNTHTWRCGSIVNLIKFTPFCAQFAHI